MRGATSNSVGLGADAVPIAFDDLVPISTAAVGGRFARSPAPTEVGLDNAEIFACIVRNVEKDDFGTGREVLIEVQRSIAMMG